MRAEEIKRSLTVFLLSLAMALSIVSVIIWAPGVRAWAFNTHRFIVIEAKDVFTDGSFFSVHYNTIYDYCIMPDVWKDTNPYEQYRHWYHIDHPHGEDEYWDGVLPWAVEDNFAMLVQSLEDADWERAAQLMGVISHYTGDGTMPLHATSDYNPGGNHVAYEHEVNTHLGEMSIPGYVPKELDNIFWAAMATLEESYGFTGYTEDKLNYWLIQDILWNDIIYHITENRMRAATQVTANVWYTAMIQAGLTIQAPTLLEPENGALVAGNNPTFTWGPAEGTDFYDFQLASDNDFRLDVVTVKSLSTTFYTPENSLPDDTWYWRVRSGDNSTHVGLWSQTWQFTAGFKPIIISPSERSGIPKETLTYDVTVTNLSSTPDNYALTVNDDAGWGPMLSKNLLENIGSGENMIVMLNVTIPETAEPGTEDNITVTATSMADNTISGENNCIARAIPPRAELGLATLYEVGLDLDVYLEDGSKLVVKFYTYMGDNQGENVVWANVTPTRVTLLENVPHPLGLPVENSMLVLTTDDTAEVISTIASFTVHQSDLRDRYIEILVAWFAHPELHDEFRAEIVDILVQWFKAPP